MSVIPKLIVLSEQFRGKSFELIQDKYICGRLDNCDITLKDPTVSSRHCEFVKTGNTFTLRDLNSTNGTRVNNVPISEQELKSSDILQVGGIEILFDCEDKSVSTALKTQTGIHLDGTQVGVSTVKKMDNFNPYQAKKGGEKTKHAIIVGVLVLLALLILLLIAYLVWILFMKGGGSSVPPPVSPRGADILARIMDHLA